MAGRCCFKGRSLRICIDYWELNKVTIKNKYPIPLITNLFDQLGKARYFTKLDLRSGYYQVRIANGDDAKTTCVTRYGSYVFLVMPFELSNASVTFCTLMNKLFHSLLDKFVVVYLDDVVVYSHILEEHVLHLKHVFHVLRDNELYVKLKKCSFAQDEFEFLGHSIKDAITSPLTDLLKKNKALIWFEECQAVFESLKKAFIEEPMLRLMDVTMPFELHTDASDFAIEGFLMHYGLSIAFDSRKVKEFGRIARAFNDAQRTMGECFYRLYHMLAEVKSGGSIIVVVDRFSKYGTFIAVPPDVTADDMTKLFFKNVVKYWGVPHEWHEQADLARASLDKAAKKIKKWADAKRRHVEFEVGDQVMVKLLPQQFKSLKKVNKGLIRSFLKPYHGDEEDPERGVSNWAPTAIVLHTTERRLSGILWKTKEALGSPWKYMEDLEAFCSKLGSRRLLEVKNKREKDKIGTKPDQIKKKQEAWRSSEKLRAVSVDRARKTEENTKRMVRNANTVKKLLKLKERSKEQGPYLQFLQSTKFRDPNCQLDFQNSFEPSNASTNVVNAPRDPYVVKKDNGSFVDEIIFDLNRAPDSPNQFHCFHWKDVLRAGETSKSSHNAQSAVTYTSISSNSDGPSWGIPLMNAGALSEMDPYEEIAQQGQAHPLSPAYVPDPMELDEHVPVYVPEPKHPEYHAPSDDDIQVEDDDEDPEEDPSEEHEPEDDGEDPEEDPSEEHEHENEDTKEPSKGSDETKPFEEDEIAVTPPPPKHRRARISVRPQTPMAASTQALINAFASGSSPFLLPSTSPAYDQ
nr:hypothetical protein [Tanacetum cinerariifolium]